MEKEDSAILKRLWEKIKRARKWLKLSQSDLAEKTWTDRSYISMVERWATNVTFLKLKRITDCLLIDWRTVV